MSIASVNKEDPSDDVFIVKSVFYRNFSFLKLAHHCMCVFDFVGWLVAESAVRLCGSTVGVVVRGMANLSNTASAL